MKTSFKITEKESDILKSMIGKTFEMFKCDSFIFSSSVYGLVGFYIGEKIYKFCAFLESAQYFFQRDDVVRIRVEETVDSEIVSMMDGGTFIDTPVKSKISSITIVNDYQKVVYGDDERCFETTKGIIFRFEDTREISFEVPTWFSEMITIRKGYNLLEKFVSENDFLEEWEKCGEYIASTKREVIVID